MQRSVFRSEKRINKTIYSVLNPLNKYLSGTFISKVNTPFSYGVSAPPTISVNHRKEEKRTRVTLTGRFSLFSITWPCSSHYEKKCINLSLGAYQKKVKMKTIIAIAFYCVTVNNVDKIDFCQLLRLVDQSTFLRLWTDNFLSFWNAFRGKQNN